MDRSLVARVQGTYYLLSGIWPLVNMDSFEAISGPKTDRWLVRTVGALLALIGGVLLLASRGKHVPADMRLLGAGSALILIVVDVTYASSGRISKVYLLDAAGEIGILAGWLLTRG